MAGLLVAVLGHHPSESFLGQVQEGSVEFHSHEGVQGRWRGEGGRGLHHGGDGSGGI